VRAFFKFSIAFLLFVSACTPQEAGNEDTFFLKPTAFAAIEEWRRDNPAEALSALQKSCDRISKKPADETFGTAGIAGIYGDWQPICAQLVGVTDATQFFEQNFTPYEIWGDEGREGLFTGYYVPELSSGTSASVPLYAMPEDLITINLGDFKPELKGETVMGRVEGKKLVPYYTRAEIEEGALKDKAQEIAHVDDPIDAFFLHIQGSGQVKKPDGTILHVGYAGQNGHPYYAIGRELIARGALTKENVSMQSIRDWLEKNPDKAQELMNANKSYVFFDVKDQAGALGAEGVVLTPGRSLAVDRRKIPYGAPVFISTMAPEGNAPITRLMIAQDTGGAIRGAVRGDFFWGAGETAAHQAGLMKSPGQAYILLPKSVTVPEAFRWNKKKRFFN
jgi:membrane-bound lytic murein transglycosylase A